MNLNISEVLKNKTAYPAHLDEKIYTLEKDALGLINIKKNSRYIHSKYNIQNECKNILNVLKEREKTNSVIFYGLGLFKVLLFFCENYKEYLNEKVSIVGVVEDINIFNYVYFNLLDEKNKKLISEFDIFFIYKEENPSLILKTLNKKYISNIAFISLPSLTKEEKNEAGNFHISLMKEMELNISNTLTDMNFETIWSRNILFNSLYLQNSSDLSCFKNIFSDLTCVLICAGPTLEHSVKKLKKERENIIIVSIDTAYNALIKNDIVPDFVVTADAGFYNVFDFTNENKKFPYLVMDLSVHRLVPHLLKDKTEIITFTSNKNIDIIKVLKEKTNTNITELFMAHTAATAMIDLANFFGVKKCLLIGFDNYYPYYYRHVKHTLSYELIISKMNKLNTLESFYFDGIKDLLIASTNTDTQNKDTQTNYIFEKQADYLKTICEKYGNMEIMRLTSDGKKIENIKEGTVDDVLIKNLNKQALLKAREAFKKNNVFSSEIKKIYKDTNKQIEKLKEEINLISFELKAIYKKENSEQSIEEADALSKKLYNLLENYFNNISVLKSILSASITLSQIMPSKTKENILSKTNFLISELIKTLNYFHTRLNIISKD